MNNLMQNLKDKCIELHNAGGMGAVDRYLDEHHRLIPWESCFECDAITPRDPQTLKCFFEEEFHDQY
jgi:hypothetical protein